MSHWLTQLNILSGSTGIAKNWVFMAPSHTVMILLPPGLGSAASSPTGVQVEDRKRILWDAKAIKNARGGYKFCHWHKHKLAFTTNLEGRSHSSLNRLPGCATVLKSTFTEWPNHKEALKFSSKMHQKPSTGCSKKWAPKVFRRFLSDHLEF